MSRCAHYRGVVVGNFFRCPDCRAVLSVVESKRCKCGDTVTLLSDGTIIGDACGQASYDQAARCIDNYMED